jgi:hypothetical protein
MLLVACGGATATVGTDGGAGGAGGGGAPPLGFCTTDADCTQHGSYGSGCAFQLGQCSGAGTCMDKAAVFCAKSGSGCGCDGLTPVSLCSPYPGGTYYDKPIASMTRCGSPAPPPPMPAPSCAISADCPSGWTCGFPGADGCSATGTCFDTSGVGVCQAYSPGCACDGTDINTICLPLPMGFYEKPLLHKGSCNAVDAGH